MREFSSSFKIPLALLLACAAAYGGTLLATQLFHDDRVLIAENPVLHRGWRAVPEIFTTGYVEPAMGAATPIQEYRPLLVLSFMAHAMTTGFAPGPMHAANLLLHWLACILLWRCLLRRGPARAAAAAALFFALLPVHTEAVGMIGWRSEILTAISILASWLWLEDGRLTSGAAAYCAGMLVKEPAILFPAFFALADWTFHARLPWDKPRRKTYPVLAACAAGYLCLRAAVLSRFMHGGVPYFSSRLTAALTVSRFAVRHYLWTAVTGIGLCSDYSRPMIPDAAASSPSAWPWLIAVIAALGASAWALTRRRAAWAFWILGPCLFLLPSSHLIFALDTLGADRFLYVPTLGLAAGLGWLYDRARPRPAAATAAAILSLWYLSADIRRSAQWTDEAGFYRAAVACNPVSAHAREGLGGALLERGLKDAGRRELLAAIALNPDLGDPYYNLARAAWEDKDADSAEKYVRRALELEPQSADAWVLLSLIARASGRLDEAEDALRKAIAAKPEDALAEFDLGRLQLERGRRAEALAHLKRFVELAPDDPDTAKVSAFLNGRSEL